MIASIRGQIKAKWDNSLLIEVRQLGYRVFVPERVFDARKIEDEVVLFTHHHQREDSQELYGFETLDDLEFFEQLIGISGIGPKTALSVLSVARLYDLQTAILHGDPSLLTNVSGIGKKTAERVILELKHKLKAQSPTGLEGSEIVKQAHASQEAVSALEQLGFSKREAEHMIEHLPPTFSTAEQKVQEALRHRGKKVRS